MVQIPALLSPLADPAPYKAAESGAKPPGTAIDFSWKAPRKDGDGLRGRNPPTAAAGAGELRWIHWERVVALSWLWLLEPGLG